MPKNLKVGLAGEYLAASHLARIFDDIFPASSSSRFDFLCHRKNINFKIQVKTSNSTFKKNNSDWVRWDIKKKISNKKEYRVYDGSEVDIFAFVFLKRDKVIFEPNYNLGKTYQKKVEYIKSVDTQESLKKSVNLIVEIKNKIIKSTDDKDNFTKEKWLIK
jgi:hypothetical protein